MQRLFIALYALWRYFLNLFCRKKGLEKHAAIAFSGIFGDAVVVMSALKGYVELFSQNGWAITILCRPSVKKFWDEVTDFPHEINVETIDFTKLVNSFSYFKEIVNRYNDRLELLIVPGSSISVEMLSTALNIKRKVGLLTVYQLRWPPHMVLFKRIAYTETVTPPFGSMMIQRYRLLLQYLGLPNYKGKLPRIKKQERIINGRYCVVCPGSSTYIKRWPSEKFAEIVDYIIEKYGWEFHVCGGADEVEDCRRMIEHSKHSDKIISHVGKTTFSEWSSIVEHAMIVIGNDSATLHLAVAHRVKAICIAGVYNKDKFFPYNVDELDDGDLLPETVYVDMPCRNCQPKGYFHGYGNKECGDGIKKGDCALCIGQVTVDTVKAKVEKLINI